MLREVPDCWVSVSATTRSPREGEQEAVQYFFKSDEEFDALVKEDGLLEWATYADHRYGTPKSAVLGHIAQGEQVVLEIDVQGALQVQKNYDDGVYIFILPPSLEELKKRIRGRGSETEETMARRLGEALHEIHNIDKYDYRVINEDLDTAIDRVRAIITAEQCKINGEEVDRIVNKYKEDL